MEIARITDQEILARLRAPATADAAFATLVRLHQQPLYAHLRHMVGDHDDADDLLQATFIKAWRNIAQFRGESKLKTWLFRIATNECLTFLEQKKRRGFVDVAELGNDLRHSHGGGAEPDGEEIQRRLEAAVGTLPDKQKQVFVMKYYDELTYEEMAGILGGTVGSLKASFHHAVKKIEQCLLAS